MHLIAAWGSPWQIVWNSAASCIVLFAAWRVLSASPPRFKNGRRSKVFWLCAVVALGASFAGLYLPIGAVWALGTLQRSHHEGAPSAHVGHPGD
jgi:hypothetical protein